MPQRSGDLGYRGWMATIGSLLAVLHAWVAIAGAVVAVILVVVGLLDGAGIGRARRWLDRLAAILFVTMVAAVLLGPGIVAGVGHAVEPAALPARGDGGADRAGPPFRGDPEAIGPYRLVDGGRCGPDAARAAQPLGNRVLRPPVDGLVQCRTTGPRPTGSAAVPQVAVGSIRKTGWSAGSGSSSMDCRQLQVIVLA